MSGLELSHRRSALSGLLLCSFGLMISAVAGPKVLPVLNHPIADRGGLAGFPLMVNLNSAFGTEPIDDQVVRFTSQFNISGVPVTMDMALFSNRTPVTRQNFLNYVAGGSYVNSFIHRSIPGFVIQGGASRIISNSIQPVVTAPAIVNEFGISNTLGTVSMAKLDSDPNSATSQWFVSLGANSDNLDTQNSGFTVFGRVTKGTFSNAQVFGNPSIFPIFNYGGIYTDLPLFYTHVASNLLPSEFILFPGVALAPLPAGQAGEDTALTYSVLSNSNAALVEATIQAGGILNLSPTAGQTGVTTITVRATDSVGNSVDDVFDVVVNLVDNYTTWASRSLFANSQNGIEQNSDGDTWSNLQEFAFMGDPAVSDQAGQVTFLRISGIAPAARYMTMTFPVRKFTQGLSYAVEANDGLSGSWAEIWKSTDGFSHSQVLTAVDQADRTVVTVKDTAVMGGDRRFLRVRTVQE